MKEIIETYDEKLFMLINGTHSKFLDYVMLCISNLFLCVPIFICIIFIANKYYKNQGDYHPRANAIMLAGILFFGFLFCLFVVPQVFNIFNSRIEPCLNPHISNWVHLVGEDCGDVNNSFAFRPCIMFCIASFLIFTIKGDFKKIKLTLIFLALLVSYSRIYLGVHYPINVFIADLIGVFCGFITSRLYFYLKYSILPF